jgi:hypothetical protein
MAECLTNRGAHTLLNAAVTGVALDLRAALVTGNATGLVDRAINTVSDVDALNAGATNIHTERIALTGETVTEDEANNRANLDAASIVFAPATGVTAVGLVIYHEGSGTDATRPVIATYTTNFPISLETGMNVPIADIVRANALTA